MKWVDPVPNRDMLLNKALPKWPQMLLTGKPVSEEQALEIIRRTDMFFLYGGNTGNNEDFEREAAKIVGMPRRDYEGNDAVEDVHEKLLLWQSKWGTIYTEYVHNDWISSAFVGGPHGWCHPDGAIGFADNVGKWPTVADLLDDWSKIAVEFPFLSLAAQFKSGEEAEENTESLVAIVVKDGDADLSYPSEGLFEGYPPPPRSSYDMLDKANELPCENAISLEIVRKWAREHADN